MDAYIGLLITILAITTLVAIISLWYVFKTYRLKKALRDEIDLISSQKTEVTYQNAMMQEINNFLYLIFLDFINTKDARDLSYKASVIRSVLDILKYDQSKIKVIKNALTIPSAMIDSIDSILMEDSEVLEPETQDAYHTFMKMVRDLESEVNTSKQTIAENRAKVQGTMFDEMRATTPKMHNTSDSFVSDGVRIMYSKRAKQAIEDLRAVTMQEHDMNTEDKVDENDSDSQ